MHLSGERIKLVKVSVALELFWLQRWRNTDGRELITSLHLQKRSRLGRASKKIALFYEFQDPGIIPSCRITETKNRKSDFFFNARLRLKDFFPQTLPSDARLLWLTECEPISKPALASSLIWSRVANLGS